MHRFVTRQTRHDARKKHIKVSYIIFLMLIVVFYLMVSSVSDSAIEKQQESLNNAINKDIMHCYAVEGFYPPSLDYMKEHYGLKYNEDIFVVDYRPIAGNIRPDYTILGGTDLTK